MSLRWRIKRRFKRLIHRPYRFLTGRGFPEFGWPETRREYEAFWKHRIVQLKFDEPNRFERDEIVLDILGDGVRRLLDVGCGAGRFLAAAEKKYITDGNGSVELWGADFAVTAVEKARKTAARCNFSVSDALNLAYGNNLFDAVVSLQTFEHLNNPASALRETYRVLAPGGKLILTVPNGDFDNSKCHANFWNRGEFEEFLSAVGRTDVRSGPPDEKGLIGIVVKPEFEKDD